MWATPPHSKIISYPPFNFSWIEYNKLAAMACPSTEANIQFLLEQGIRHIITLSPENLPVNIVCNKMGWTKIDIEEFEAPTTEDIQAFIRICETCLGERQAVGIHCRMGRGRTGVMAACYLVHFRNLAPDRAITNVRLMRPGSIETYEQEKAVVKYHDFLRTEMTDIIS